MKWEPWSRNDPQGLSRYVTSEAKQWLALDVNRFDVGDQRRVIIQAIYNALVAKDIRYNLEDYHPAERLQHIRTPAEILDAPREGTCLDLAALFCGLCLGNELLPILIVVEGHALAAVSLTHGLRDWNGYRPERAWVETDPLTDPARLRQLIDSGAYLAIECTGFAHSERLGQITNNPPPESIERTNGVLSFERAVAAGREQLDWPARPFQFALDIAVAHNYWRIEPYPVDLATQAVLFVGRDFIFKHPLLADHIYDFSDLIASETEGFVGRDWIMEDLAHFQEEYSAGYFCVVAEAGLGKTALAAELARRHQAPAFFFSVSEGHTHMEECLRHLAADLIARFSLAYNSLPDRAAKDWNFLKTLLDEARKKRAQPLVVIIDAVDEAEESTGSNTLLVPAQLPQGVYIVLTSRTKPTLYTRVDTGVRVLTIAVDDKQHRRDIEDFLDAQAVSPKLRAALGDGNRSVQALMQALLDASENNFMYLQYVLRDLIGSQSGPGTIQLNALPSGLQGYYEQFWQAMEVVRGTEGWSDWNELYRPTIALLGAALEPVTADWISMFIGRPAEEIEERALTRWERFLRRQKKRNCWHIVHKSFADFLTENRKVDMPAAHNRIAEYYLTVWGGLPEGLPDLSIDAADEWVPAYGWRYIAEHLRKSGDSERLRKLVEYPRWRTARMAQDPSGQSYQGDLTQTWAAVESRNREQAGRGQVPSEVAQELRYALGVASVNTLSNHLSAELIEALVASGHWGAKTALAAVQINPATYARAEALAALAPYLDVVMATEALKLARGESALLRRLCEFGHGEHALAEAKLLEGDAAARVLGELADCWPHALLSDAIAFVRGLIATERTIRFPNSRVIALARLFRHAPKDLLPEAQKAVLSLDNHYQYEVREAIALRWAELGRWQEADENVKEIGSKAVVLGKMLRYVPKHDQRRREQLAEDVLALVSDEHPSGRAEIVVDVLPAFSPERQLEVLQRALPKPDDYRADYELEILAPVLPPELIETALTLANSLKGERHEPPLTALSMRLAALGRIEEAIGVAKSVGDSYDVKASMSTLLRRLAELGHTERAVSETLTWAQYGREDFLPGTLVGVARHVSAPLLDTLRDRARSIQDAKRRRYALLGIAPRYARLGKPEEALALARVIDDEEERLKLRERIVLCWASQLREPGRALAEALSLPLPHWKQMRALEALAAELPAPLLRQALTYIQEQCTTDWSRLSALAALLTRLVQFGYAEEAWQFANGEPEENRFGLLAQVAADLIEPERTARLESLVQEIVAWPFEWESARVDALEKVIPYLSERPLRAAVKYLSESQAKEERGDTKKVLTLSAGRLFELGQVEEGLQLVREWGLWRSDYYAQIAPHLDKATVLDWASELLSHPSLTIIDVEAISSLLARLTDLGGVRDALKLVGKLPKNRVKYQAIARLTPGLPRDMLEEAAGLAQNSRPAVWWSVSAEREEDFQVRLERARALAAIACRYAALGLPEDAMEIARSIPDSYSMAQALAGLAPSLQGTLFEEALALSLNMWSDEVKGTALSGLLPRLAEQGVEQAHRAFHIACEVIDSKARITALTALVPRILKLPAPDLYSLWANVLHILSKRTRPVLLSDLDALIPVLAQLGGGKALEEVTEALVDVASCWP
jgi:hypothetical protein